MNRLKIYTPLLLLVLCACTENILWDDDDTGDVISGTVLLNANDSPEDLYIWFEEFNYVTHPDADGNFKIPIPSIDSPISGQSVSGHFPIYFYQNNYAIDSISVEFINGKLVSPQPLLTEDFKLKETIQLKKLLEVSAETYFIDDITIGVETQITPLVDSVRVMLYGQIFQGYLQQFAGVVLVNLNSDEIAVNENPECTVIPYNFYYSSLWMTEARFDPNATQKGVHDLVAIPYIVVLHDGVEHIRQRIGLEKENYTKDYLDLPFSRTGGIVEE